MQGGIRHPCKREIAPGSKMICRHCIDGSKSVIVGIEAAVLVGCLHIGSDVKISPSIGVLVVKIGIEVVVHIGHRFKLSVMPFVEAVAQWGFCMKVSVFILSFAVSRLADKKALVKQKSLLPKVIQKAQENVRGCGLFCHDPYRPAEWSY